MAAKCTCETTTPTIYNEHPDASLPWDHNPTGTGGPAQYEAADVGEDENITFDTGDLLLDLWFQSLPPREARMYKKEHEANAKRNQLDMAEGKSCVD